MDLTRCFLAQKTLARFLQRMATKLIKATGGWNFAKMQHRRNTRCTVIILARTYPSEKFIKFFTSMVSPPQDKYDSHQMDRTHKTMKVEGITFYHGNVVVRQAVEHYLCDTRFPNSNITRKWIAPTTSNGWSLMTRWRGWPHHSSINL